MAIGQFRPEPEPRSDLIQTWVRQILVASDVQVRRERLPRNRPDVNGTMQASRAERIVALNDAGPVRLVPLRHRSLRLQPPQNIHFQAAVWRLRAGR